MYCCWIGHRGKEKKLNDYGENDMNAEEFVYVIMVIICVFCSVSIGACIAMILLFFYWENLTMPTFIFLISVGGGTLAFMIFSEILLGLIHALYGIRNKIKESNQIQVAQALVDSKDD